MILMLLSRDSGSLGPLWGFHEEREQRPQAEDVDELDAVVDAFQTIQCMRKNFQGTRSRLLLFPESAKYQDEGYDYRT